MFQLKIGLARAQPCRDWKADPDFNFSWPSNDFPPFNVAVAQLLTWLCGEDWRHWGGQGWPCFSSTDHGHDQPGLPEGLRRQR